MIEIENLFIERDSDITCNKYYWTFLPIGIANTKDEMVEKITKYFQDGTTILKGTLKSKEGL